MNSITARIGIPLIVRAARLDALEPPSSLSAPSAPPSKLAAASPITLTAIKPRIFRLDGFPQKPGGFDWHDKCFTSFAVSVKGQKPIGGTMQTQQSDRQGKLGYVLAWALGVPIPVLIIIYLIFNGCSG